MGKVLGPGTLPLLPPPLPPPTNLLAEPACLPTIPLALPSTLCSGGFATIYRCTDVESGETFALKHFILTCVSLEVLSTALRSHALLLLCRCPGHAPGVT